MYCRVYWKFKKTQVLHLQILDTKKSKIQSIKIVQMQILDNIGNSSVSTAN